MPNKIYYKLVRVSFSGNFCSVNIYSIHPDLSLFYNIGEKTVSYKGSDGIFVFDSLESCQKFRDRYFNISGVSILLVHGHGRPKRPKRVCVIESYLSTLLYCLKNEKSFNHTKEPWRFVESPEGTVCFESVTVLRKVY